MKSASAMTARVVLALAFMGVCLGMRAIDAGHNLVTVSGAPLLLYNLASIPFVLLAGASFFSLGALLVPSAGLRSCLDVFLVRSLAGFSLFSLFGYALGMARLLLPEISLAALALPLLWFPAEALPPYSLSRKAKLHLSLFALVALYLLCFSGVLYYYVENDFSHYYYMYDTALLRGDLLSNISFYAYYYMKGAGAPFLMMAATTKFSIQLATLYAMLMMGLVTYRLGSMLTNNSVAPLAAALFMLASKAMKIESYKGHTLISMFILAVPYLMARLALGPQTLRPRLRLVLAVLLCATILLSPPAAVFLVVPLLFLLGASLLHGKVGSFAQIFAVACVPAVTFVAVLAANYLLTGVPEITPLGFFSQYFNPQIMHAWISDVAMRVSLNENVGLDGFVFPTAKLLWFLASVCAFGAGYYAVRRVLARTNPHGLKRLEVVFAPVLALGGICPFLYDITIQSSIKRYIVFYSPIQGLYVVIGVVAATALLVPALRRRFPGLWPARKVATLLCGLMACYGLVFNWTPKLPHQIAHTRYFFGATSLSPVLGHWFKPEVAEIDRYVPKGSQVLPLYFSPYATLYNPQKYLRHVLNPHNAHLTEFLSPDPEKARAAYLSVGLRHFMVNTSMSHERSSEPDLMLSMVDEAFGELFSPASVARYFRVRNVGGDCWLLVLDGGDADGERPSEAFLEAYAQRRNWDMQNPRSIFYPHLVRASQQIPSLELPKEPANLPQ